MNQKTGVVEAKGRDGNDESKKGGTSHAMKMMNHMDAKEVEDTFKADSRSIP